MPDSARRAMLPIAFACLAILCGGCPVGKAPFEEDDRATLEPADRAGVTFIASPAQQRVARAAPGALSLVTLEAAAKLKAVDPRNEFRLRCDVRLLAARPDRLRMFATKALGTEILDLALAGESLDVWLPRDKKLLRGHAGDLADAGVSFHPREILDHLLLPDGFARRDWRIVEENDDRVVLEAPAPDETVERIVLDGQDGLLRRREIRLRGVNAPQFVVAYDRYRPLDGEDALPFAHRMRITVPGADREILFVVTRLTPNPQVRPRDFRLLVDPDATVEPLAPDDAARRERQWREALESAAESAE